VTGQYHKKFKLNGKSFSSSEALIAYSETISDELEQFLKHWFNNADYVEAKTSGSTGTPKVVQIKKEYMVNSALATAQFFNIYEKTKALLCLPISYIAGKMMLVRALVLGWEIDIVEPTSNPLKNITKQYGFCAMVPLQLFNSVPNLNVVKKVIVGGGAVSNKVIDAIQDVDTEIFETYGMTETVTHIALRKLNHTNIGQVSFFKVLPNITISLDNRGCLVVNAPKISPNCIVTNDLADVISETEFSWLGRIDSVINSGGIKLIPEQIEQQLAAVFDFNFFVTGLPDEKLGERLFLLIENNSDLNLKKVLEKEILRKIDKLTTLKKYEKPKQIIFLDSFSYTHTNKINRITTLEKVKNIY
jgi:O-succinylbenzoic acid--CoA ligase